MTTKEMSDFLNSLWCWARCTEEEQRKLSEIADYLSSRGNVPSELEKNSKKLEKNFGELDCISRAGVIKILGKIEQMVWDGEGFDYEESRAMIDELPSVTPQELKTGHWIEDAEQHHVEKTYHCSECGHGVWGEYEKTEYCGGCGAKMVEPQESEEQEDGE